MFLMLTGSLLGLIVLIEWALVALPLRHVGPAARLATPAPVAPSAQSQASTPQQTAVVPPATPAEPTVVAAALAARDAHEMVTWSMDGLDSWLAGNEDLAVEARDWLRQQIGRSDALNS